MRDSAQVNALLDRMIPRHDHRRVFNLMRSRPMGRSLGNNNYWFRVIDVQQATGHNSDEQRLRELRTEYPALFRVRKVTYKDRGGSHLEHQLRRDWLRLLQGIEKEGR